MEVCVRELAGDVGRFGARASSGVQEKASNGAGGQTSATGIPDVNDLPALLCGENGAYIEGLLEDYLSGSAPIPEEWRALFDQWLGNGRPASARSAPAVPAQIVEIPQERPLAGVFGLVDAYRTHGHLIANIDPLRKPPESHPLLNAEQFGFRGSLLEQRIRCGHYRGLDGGTPLELIESLRRTYCRTFAVEFMEMRNKDQHDWLTERMEPVHNRPALYPAYRRRILRELLAAERFEQFLHRRFLGQKRFSIEGGEAMIPMMEEIVEQAAEVGVAELVIAMAHRGRLNVLTHIMTMPYEAIFMEFQRGLVPSGAQGSGDVKYHRGYSSDRVTASGRKIHLSLCPNPSHLEAVNPVAEGMVRAKQDLRGDVTRSQIIPIQIHGDAAFSGQGLVAETLSLSELATYRTGGTIHIIINNQIGFTTDPESYRFTKHPSDIAKVIQAPIFHVNADDPEACVHAARLAVQFRNTFHEDVIIDLVCYRRHGHNEGDDPSFTQPKLYKQIESHSRAGEIHTRRLLAEGAITKDEVDTIETELRNRLADAIKLSEDYQQTPSGARAFQGRWTGHSGKLDASVVTEVLREELLRIGACFTQLPVGFAPHPKVLRIMEQRAESILAGGPLDWGAGEALALGSLLAEGIPVRMTGQDVERGTFSHRHGVLHDVETGARYMPLGAIAKPGARLTLANSLLSEAAVLGFEYGYSSVDPDQLVIWEAQFGDFANGAQIIIDQFISSAEQKWNRASGLTMLLPHGYEGQGPEHSSARLERFLQLCAEDNMIVAYPTTPAQIFHLLRRQAHGVSRKPLVVMSPKSLLRHPKATSRLSELASGRFLDVIDDPAVEAGKVDRQTVRRVLLCSGKIYYALVAAREEHAFWDVAIVRVEQLHPFPFDLLRETLGKYNTRSFTWVQEEPWNMGARSFVAARVARVLPQRAKLSYAGRPEAASPATGSYRVHEQEEVDLLREAFAKRQRRFVSV
jgi:2-oxoglutarate dehydrogenase E1 component